MSVVGVGGADCVEPAGGDYSTVGPRAIIWGPQAPPPDPPADPPAPLAFSRMGNCGTASVNIFPAINGRADIGMTLVSTAGPMTFIVSRGSWSNADAGTSDTFSQNGPVFPPSSYWTANTGIFVTGTGVVSVTWSGVAQVLGFHLGCTFSANDTVDVPWFEAGEP